MHWYTGMRVSVSAGDLNPSSPVWWGLPCADLAHYESSITKEWFGGVRREYGDERRMKTTTTLTWAWCIRYKVSSTGYFCYFDGEHMFTIRHFIHSIISTLALFQLKTKHDAPQKTQWRWPKNNEGPFLGVEETSSCSAPRHARYATSRAWDVHRTYRHAPRAGRGT